MALKDYTQARGKGKPTDDAEDARVVLEETIDILRGMLPGFDYADFRTRAWQLLPGAANHMLAADPKDGKQRFADNVLAASKALALCGTLDEAKEYRDELALVMGRTNATPYGSSTTSPPVKAPPTCTAVGGAFSCAKNGSVIVPTAWARSSAASCET